MMSPDKFTGDKAFTGSSESDRVVDLIVLDFQGLLAQIAVLAQEGRRDVFAADASLVQIQRMAREGALTAGLPRPRAKETGKVDWPTLPVSTGSENAR